MILQPIENNDQDKHEEANEEDDNDINFEANSQDIEIQAQEMEKK